MVTTTVLIALLILTTATDLRRRKIYNSTTYPGIVVAWGLNTIASLLAGTQSVDPRVLASWGFVGLPASLAGFLVCGGVLLVCYALFQVGGGDVKLAAMVGSFCGPEAGITIMLWTFVFGGCAGLILLVWRVHPLRLFAWSLRHLQWLWISGRPQGLTPKEREQLRPPLHLSPSALAAALVVQFSLLDALAAATR